MNDAEFFRVARITPTEITPPRQEPMVIINGQAYRVTAVQFSHEPKLLLDSLRIADSVNVYLRGQLERVTDSRDSLKIWRTWCLILAAGMAASIIVRAGVWWGAT